MKSQLFLHMGPGFHSQVEKQLFQTSYPKVEFWEQPFLDTIESLEDADTEKALELFQQNGGEPIDLIGHSFGGSLVLAIAKKYPHILREIKLVNSGPNPFECFLNMSFYLLCHKDEGAFLSKTNFLKGATVDDKLKFIIELATAEGFSDIYWFSKERMEFFKSVFATHPALNVENFLKVFGSFLQRQQTQPEITKPIWSGLVTIYHSQEDYLYKQADQRAMIDWLKYFPQAQINLLRNSGHNSHIEDQALSLRIFNKN